MPNHLQTHAAVVRPASSQFIPRAERCAAALLLIIAFALRCFYIFRFRYDSDEPQHLHTTWGWTQGLIQYRDFFDNHTPLFHLLFSPLVALVGERTDILTFMRFAMVPLAMVALWAIWHIGSRVYSRRVGLWATVFLALLPWWFFPSIEYRTDNLWAPLWLCALAVLTTGRPGLRRFFWGGLLLGIGFGASMKTSLLVPMGVIAAGLAPHLCERQFSYAALKSQFKPGLLLLAGMVIVPSALCAAFAAKGCWAEFYYGAVGHNLMPTVDADFHPWYQRMIFPVALPFLLWAAVRIGRNIPDRRQAVLQTALFLWAGLYYTALHGFWALLTRQDYLPLFPVAILVVTPRVLQWADAMGRKLEKPSPVRYLAAAALAEIVLIFGGRPPYINGTLEQRELFRQTLQLTRPGEWVMDFKGQAVFRRRAFYYVMEPLTMFRMKYGLIANTIPRDMAEKGVCVVVNRQHWYGKKTFQFITENYLPAGQVRVAGRVISSHPTQPEAALQFTVAIPARYILWGGERPVQGLLDGLPYTGPRQLAPGPHTFQSPESYPSLALYWERAAHAGYTPIVNTPGWLHEP